MKKIIFVTLAVIVIHITAQAQGRHVQGITLTGVSYGISPGTNGSTQIIELNYSKFLRKNWLLNLSGLYEFGAIQTTEVHHYLFNGGIDYTTFQIGNHIFFNAGLSVIAGGETLQSSVNSEKKNLLVAGISGNVNIRIFLFDGMVLQVKAEQNHLPNSMPGKWYPSYYVGIRYCFF